MQNQISLKYLKGDKIFLREMTLDDAPYIVEWRNDPEIKKWMFHQKEITIEEHINWFNNRHNRIDFMIYDLKINEPIGTISFSNICNEEAEAGRILGNKSYWGRGYAKEAWILWLNIGFIDLKLQKIYGYTMTNNKANIGLNFKLGYNVNFNEVHKIIINNQIHYYLKCVLEKENFKYFIDPRE